jgi:signal transduction histidine kinase
MNSSLSTRLVLIFMLIAFIDSAFLVALCIDMLNADQLAAKEFRLLKVSESVAVAAPLYERYAKSLERALKNSHHSPAVYDDYKNNLRMLARYIDAFSKQMEESGLDQTPIDSIREIFDKLDKQAEPYLIPNDSAKEITLTSAPAHVLMRHFYDALEQEMQSLSRSLSGQAEMAFKLAKDASDLLYVAIGVNVVLVVFLAYWIDRKITGPIARLIRECEKLRFAEILTKPKASDDEIGILQQGFYEMSQSINQHEKRRANYLELFRSVQAASLTKTLVTIEKLLSSDCAKNEVVHEKLSTAADNVRGMLEILNSMAEALSSNEFQSPVLRLADSNSDSIVRDAILAVDSLAQIRNIQIKTEGEAYQCCVDERLLARALTNLLSNGIKYAHNRVVVRVEQYSKAELSFSVVDDGPGIRAEDQQNLFKEFSQLQATDEVNRTGTGLGLNICKQIVETHGGQINCNSAPGEGSSFNFRIPIVPVKRSELPLAERRPQISPVERATEKKKRTSRINQLFTVILLCFLVPQAMLGINVHSKINEAARQARVYADQKDIALKAQGLFMDSLGWEIDMYSKFATTDTRDFDSTIILTASWLKQQSAEINWLIKHSQPLSPLWRAAVKLSNDQKQFTSFFKPLTGGNPEQTVGRARLVANTVQRDINRVIKLTTKDAQESYNLSSEVRVEIITQLAWIALLNVLILSMAAALGLKLTSRIAVLKGKTEQFAQGVRLQPTLAGNDELTQLDRSLCLVSDAIKSAEARRQSMINTLNHDVRSPLSNVVGACQLVQIINQNTSSNEEEQLNAVENELMALLSRINDLLTVEKIDAGAYQIALEELEFETLLDQAVTKVLNSSTEVELKLDISPSCQSATIRGEENLLIRLFEIVLSNALRASTANTTVLLSAYCQEGILHVTVKDQAGGIPPELMSQIFERFRFIGDRPVTGLGLPLARRICGMIGATIDLQGDRDGTLAHLSIPLALDSI